MLRFSAFGVTGFFVGDMLAPFLWSFDVFGTKKEQAIYKQRWKRSKLSMSGEKSKLRNNRC